MSDLTLVEEYFKGFNPKKSSALDLFDAIKNCRYDSKNKNPKLTYISDFEMIEKSKNIVSVFINIGRKACKCKKAYLALKKDGLSKDERLKLKEVFDTKFKKDFHQRIITVPKDYTVHLQPIHETNPALLVANHKEYIWKTGFDRKSKKVELETSKSLFL